MSRSVARRTPTKETNIETLDSKIKEIQVSICKHKDLSLISEMYAKGIVEVYESKSLIFNYLLKQERILAFSALMNYVFSGGIMSLTDFYNFCVEKQILGKNHAIRFVDYMTHSGQIFLIKETDRRKKTPVLTEAGRRDLDFFFYKTITPLSIYDSRIDVNTLLSDKFYKIYYSNLTDYLSLSMDSILGDKKLLGILSKSSGMLFLMRILIDVREGNLRVDSPLTSSFFKEFPRKVKVSHSHSRNLLELLINGNLVEKGSEGYIIKHSLIKTIEKLIALKLATIYYFINA